MKNEDKQLLLQDLCARLPYGVKGNFQNSDDMLLRSITIMYSFLGPNGMVMTGDIKPYLFPLSSMTEAQRIELYKVLGLGYESHYHLSKEWEDFNESIDNNGLFLPASWVSELNKMYNWLNKNHFDHHGLIEKGLAIDATGLNIY